MKLVSAMCIVYGARKPYSRSVGKSGEEILLLTLREIPSRSEGPGLRGENLYWQEKNQETLDSIDFSTQLVEQGCCGSSWRDSHVQFGRNVQ